ncbi:MAG: hypothetical protein AAGG53_13780, partial [Cyanobacteria bacterium P01_H01_bin.152]
TQHSQGFCHHKLDLQKIQPIYLIAENLNPARWVVIAKSDALAAKISQLGRAIASSTWLSCFKPIFQPG